MAADQYENFLAVCYCSDSYGESLCRNCLRVISEESGVYDPCICCEVSESCAGCQGCERLVECEVSVNTDAAHEEVDSAVACDLLFVTCALAFRIVCHSVEDVDVLRLHVNKMIEEVVMHEVPVALVVLMRKSEVLVHVECNDVGKAELAGLVLGDEFLIYADRGASCRKSEDERSVCLRACIVSIDLGCDVVCSPLAHLVVIVLNYYSHCSTPFSVMISITCPASVYRTVFNVLVSAPVSHRSTRSIPSQKRLCK